MNCEIGVEWIGYIMICFGVVNIIGFLISGVFGKCVGRFMFFIVVIVLNILVFVVMEFWYLVRK